MKFSVWVFTIKRWEKVYWICVILDTYWNPMDLIFEDIFWAWRKKSKDVLVCLYAFFYIPTNGKYQISERKYIRYIWKFYKILCVRVSVLNDTIGHNELGGSQLVWTVIKIPLLLVFYRWYRQKLVFRRFEMLSSITWCMMPWGRISINATPVRERKQLFTLWNFSLSQLFLLNIKDGCQKDEYRSSSTSFPWL